MRPRARAASPELPIAIRTLRTKRSRPMRLIGEAENRARKAASSRDGEIGERRRVEVVAGGELRFPRRLRELVPRADREAIVAAIDAVADRPPEFARDRPRRARSSDRRCSGGHRADRAPGRRWSDRCRGRRGRCRSGRSRLRPAAAPASVSDGAEEEPRAEVAADEIGVLALPADAGGGGERLFHQRRGVDEDLHARRPCAPGEAPAEPLQPALDEVVIVAIAGIDRDRRRGPSARGSPADRCPVRS